MIAIPIALKIGNKIKPSETDQEPKKKGLRLSCIKSDPGYAPEACGFYEAYLDGRPVLDCHTADEGTGECIVFETPGNKRLKGERVIDHFGRVSKILKGDVKIMRIR